MGSESKEVGTNMDFDDLPDILSNIDMIGARDVRNGGLTAMSGKNNTQMMKNIAGKKVEGRGSVNLFGQQQTQHMLDGPNTKSVSSLNTLHPPNLMTGPTSRQDK